MLETDIEPRTEVEGVAFRLFDGMGPDVEGFKATFSALLAEDAVWETVGLPPRVGRAACVAYIDDLHARTGVTHCTIRVRAMASNETAVFTERDDLIQRADGTAAISARVSGVIEVVDGLVTRFTDYFDLSPLRPPA